MALFTLDNLKGNCYMTLPAILPTAIRQHRAEAVNVKIKGRSVSFFSRMRGGQLQTENILKRSYFETCRLKLKGSDSPATYSYNFKYNRLKTSWVNLSLW